jgi:hypothetical protein
MIEKIKYYISIIMSIWGVISGSTKRKAIQREKLEEAKRKAARARKDNIDLRQKKKSMERLKNTLQKNQSNEDF